MTPTLRELVGEEGAAPEPESLRRVHELLADASPPPRLPRRLARPPRLRPRFAVSSRTRVQGAGLLAAAAIAVGFAVGFSLDREPGFSPISTLAMHGVGTLRTASATIEVGRRDAGGNRPLRMTVRGLPRLPNHGWYELYLTNEGEREVSCGTFTTAGAGVTRVRLNAPTDLDEYDGWVVTAHRPGIPERTLLTT